MGRNIRMCKSKTMNIKYYYIVLSVNVKKIILKL